MRIVLRVLVTCLLAGKWAASATAVGTNDVYDVAFSNATLAEAVMHLNLCISAEASPCAGSRSFRVDVTVPPIAVSPVLATNRPLATATQQLLVACRKRQSRTSMTKCITLRQTFSATNQSAAQLAKCLQILYQVRWVRETTEGVVLGPFEESLELRGYSVSRDTYYWGIHAARVCGVEPLYVVGDVYAWDGGEECSPQSGWPPADGGFLYTTNGVLLVVMSPRGHALFSDALRQMGRSGGP